jgi:SAM-dependent methyltransferase
VSQGWEDRAQQWLAWARTPGDAYWLYRDAFFALLDPPAGEVLEVGSGEGRVARDLAARGYAVTGLEPSPTLLAAARERDPDGTYVPGAAEALPFGDGSFPLVVAYNTLMDVDDMPRAVAEIGRVLAPGGALCACITHPMADAGSFDGEHFVIHADYLGGGDRGPIPDERDGLSIAWDGRHQPLRAYARALEDAGLVIEALREPQPPPDAPERYRSWRKIPMFLMFRARARE